MTRSELTITEDRRKAERRQHSYRVQVIWRGRSEGEVAASYQQVILSDDHGTVLTYSREAFSEIVEGYERLRLREAAER